MNIVGIVFSLRSGGLRELFWDGNWGSNQTKPPLPLPFPRPRTAPKTAVTQKPLYCKAIESPFISCIVFFEYFFIYKNESFPSFRVVYINLCIPPSLSNSLSIERANVIAKEMGASGTEKLLSISFTDYNRIAAHTSYTDHNTKTIFIASRTVSSLCYNQHVAVDSFF